MNSKISRSSLAKTKFKSIMKNKTISSTDDFDVLAFVFAFLAKASIPVVSKVVSIFKPSGEIVEVEVNYEKKEFECSYENVKEVFDYVMEIYDDNYVDVNLCTAAKRQLKKVKYRNEKIKDMNKDVFKPSSGPWGSLAKVFFTTDPYEKEIKDLQDKKNTICKTQPKVDSYTMKNIKAVYYTVKWMFNCESDKFVEIFVKGTIETILLKTLSIITHGISSLILTVWNIMKGFYYLYLYKTDAENKERNLGWGIGYLVNIAISLISKRKRKYRGLKKLYK